MSIKEEFIKTIKDGYSFKSESITIGSAILNGECLSDARIMLPLKTMNRHGLIAGATGTGKTKTLQLISEELSRASVPVLLMDIKGDLSGIAKPGQSDTKDRQLKTGISVKPEGFPVELLTISKQKGTRLRATITEFGPVLISKVLGLNETQSSIVSLIFRYCDENKLPLLDIKDLKKAVTYLSNEGKKEIENSYGKISLSSSGIILRKIIELEEQGIEQFFGERSFDVNDLLRIDEQGRGMISIIKLNDIQDRPKLFSTFMLSLVSEIFASFPEEGDIDRPKLTIFIDEAHLIFEEATPALLDQIETIVKLIRSKGVGIFLCTQNPGDIPEKVLGQLGMKIQHALRAFTAKDRKMIKLISENFPVSQFYNIDEIMTSLGIGEALVTALNENGIPTPLVSTLMKSPSSRMNPLTDAEIDEIIRKSNLATKYNQAVDRESAYEILTSRINDYHANEISDKSVAAKSGAEKKHLDDNSILDNPLLKSIGRQVTNTVAKEITRGLLGAIGLGGSSRRRR